jgi:hypothetical protein
VQFWAVWRVAKNPPQLALRRILIYGHFPPLPIAGRKLWFPARGQVFCSRYDPSGILARTGRLKGLPVIPGHPVRRVLGQFLGVFLQFHEVFEGTPLAHWLGCLHARRISATQKQMLSVLPIAYRSEVVGSFGTVLVHLKESS